MEETSKVPSLQDGSTSVTDDEGWNSSSRSRCRRPKWTREEEMVLVEAHATLGNAWVAIAECLPQRSSAEVKNIWHSTLRARKLQTRSVLRAYVTALKDRADKPAARQQALRAAQLFLSEGSGKAACSPAKRVPRRPSGQQRQQPPQQLQLQQPRQRSTGTAASPPQPQPAAAPATASRDAQAGAGHAPTPSAALAAPAAMAGAPTVHRSSLGSEWSCNSSGALESWAPATTTGSVGNTIPKPPTPPPVISFSPLVNCSGAAATGSTYAAPPHAASACAAPRAASRYDSPTLRADSPQLSHPPACTVECGRSDRRSGGGGASRSCEAKPTAAQPLSGSAATWLAPAAAAAHPRQVGVEVAWRGRAADPGCSSWNQAPFAPAAMMAPAVAQGRWGYVVSTGGCGAGGSYGAADGGSEMWQPDGGRTASSLALALPGSHAGASASALPSHSHSYTTHVNVGSSAAAATSKLFATSSSATAGGARSAAGIAAALRAAGAAPAGTQSSYIGGLGFALSGRSGGAAVVADSAVVMGLSGITDAELLACIGL